jgi:hypothetical protein
VAALSQSVVINFLTKFDKKGLDKATKDLKGFDKFLAQSKFLGKAKLVAGAVAGVVIAEKIARASIQAALEQERLDKSIEQSLRTINRLGDAQGVKLLITDLQRATNISEGVLTPALNSLIVQTGDLEQSQKLLQIAIDTSAGSGRDLSSVTDALAKASRGNFRALGQLNLGFDAATAKQIGLAEITDYLTLKFDGAAQRATQTFGGQLDKLKISAGEAAENLGEGFITGIEVILGGADAAGFFGAKLETLGLNAGYVFVALAEKISKVTDALTAASKNPIFKFILENLPVVSGWVGLFDKLAEDGKKISEGLEKDVELTKEQKEQAAKLAALQTKLDKIAAANLAKQKKVTAEQKAQKELAAKKAELEAMFDMDRINLQAALSRKLSAEDEARVKILQRLAEGTKEAVDEAQRYADVLKVIEDGKITTGEIDELAKKWGMTTTGVVLYIEKLFAANEEIKKMLALLSQVKIPEIPKPPIVQTQAAIETLSPKIQEAILTGADPVAEGEKVRKQLLKEMGKSDPFGAGAAASGRLTAQAIAYYQNLLDIPRMADGGIVTRPTQALIGEGGAEAVIPLDRMGNMGQRVVVNVAGSVISEGQLQSVIQDVLYNLNRTGASTQLTNLGR